ncbi:hypothetical protein [Runella sp.]|uniref:hypothetical protein n=1 Tax=Runella sp. TaxID=1960881 RepID=UPI003D0E5F50
MQRLSDDELFDVLDGAANEEVVQRHHYWLKADASYHEYFTELSQMHNDLGALSIEVPSMAFENKVMHQWELAQARSLRPALTKWMPFLFVAIVSIISAACMLITGANQSPAPETGLLKQLNVNVPIIQQVLLLLNAILFLLVVERMLRKRLKQHY